MGSSKLVGDDEGRVPECDVLVVDDQLFHRDMMCEMLRAKGLAVESVQSGDEALRAYPYFETKPIIIMDNVMPRMTGVEATRAIKSMDPEAKIIFVSSDIAQRPEAIEAGAIGFVMKPFRITEVFAAINWVRSQRAAGAAAEEESG
jgi:CheY-like chemotaxis protein